MKRRDFITAAAGLALVPAMVRAQGPSGLWLRCRFADQDFRYALMDNATVRDLITLLPAELIIEDFSNNEKLAHLPRRLDETGRQPITDERAGDLCYFRGWGNLAFFHSGYSYRDDLVRLGRIEGDVAPLLVRGEHPLRLDLIAA